MLQCEGVKVGVRSFLSVQCTEQDHTRLVDPHEFFWRLNPGRLLCCVFSCFTCFHGRIPSSFWHLPKERRTVVTVLVISRLHDYYDCFRPWVLCMNTWIRNQVCSRRTPKSMSCVWMCEFGSFQSQRWRRSSCVPSIGFPWPLLWYAVVHRLTFSQESEERLATVGPELCWNAFHLKWSTRQATKKRPSVLNTLTQTPEVGGILTFFASGPRH